MPDHADTATARIRNAHAREVHPSQPRHGWLDATLNRKTTPVTPSTPVMVLRITYKQPSSLEADLSSDYYIVVAADDPTLYEAQRISEHDDVFGVGVYDPQHVMTDDGGLKASAPPVAVYVRGKAVML